MVIIEVKDLQGNTLKVTHEPGYNKAYVFDCAKGKTVETVEGSDHQDMKLKLRDVLTKKKYRAYDWTPINAL